MIFHTSQKIITMIIGSILFFFINLFFMIRFSLPGYIGATVLLILAILFIIYDLNLIQAGSIVDRLGYIYILSSYAIVLGLIITDVVLVIHNFFIKKQVMSENIYGMIMNMIFFIILGMYFLSIQTA